MRMFIYYDMLGQDPKMDEIFYLISLFLRAIVGGFLFSPELLLSLCKSNSSRSNALELNSEWIQKQLKLSKARNKY